MATDSVKKDSKAPARRNSAEIRAVRTGIREELFELMRVSGPGEFQDRVVEYIHQKQLEERQEILAYLETTVPKDAKLNTAIRLIESGAHKR